MLDKNPFDRIMNEFAELHRKTLDDLERRTDRVEKHFGTLNVS